jgi:hypothetical protein
MSNNLFLIIIFSTVVIIICSFTYFKHINKEQNNKKQIIQKIIRGIARWSNASQQDESPLISVLHSNYAAGYLWALDDIASEKEIKEASGVDFHKLTDVVTKYQDKSIKEAVKVCPAYANNLDPYLSKLGGES